MATIPSGVITHGADSWLPVSLTQGERRMVLSASSPGHPRTLVVRNKLLPKTAARPYDVLQVTVLVQNPISLDELQTVWVTDNVSVVISLPVAESFDATFADRLNGLLQGPLVYLTGGASPADLTAIVAIVSDNIANQLTLGLI